ncbi:hypothetical protein V1477_016861 [Vespula maculifrons]|uniref:Uncharacterized protein n=1 Tax=Vespula maculifrons TaxID=7453 RepID=A0ABD2B4F3_VESMC
MHATTNDNLDTNEGDTRYGADGVAVNSKEKDLEKRNTRNEKRKKKSGKKQRILPNTRDKRENRDRKECDVIIRELLRYCYRWISFDVISKNLKKENYRERMIHRD